MLPLPDVSYVFDDDGTPLAYRVFDGGPGALILVPGMGGTIEVLPELPGFLPWIGRFTHLAQVVLAEKRGHGLSGRSPTYPSLETRSTDVLRVMDNLGIDRAVLLGISESCAMCTVLTATRPERVDGLVLSAGFARLSAASSCSWGMDAGDFMNSVRTRASDWGTSRDESAGRVSPRLADNDEWRRLWTRMLRIFMSPDELAPAWELILQMDTRDVLSSIQRPTAVIHSTRDLIVPIQFGRYLAEHIRGATMYEIDSNDPLPWMSDPEQAATATISVVNSEQPAARLSNQPERRLSTVLFTDIVESTATASRLGDGRWKEVLDEHDRLAQDQVKRFGGRLIKSTGDGILAIFDGPGRAVGAAVSVRNAVGMLGLEMRAGVHTGEIELRGDDVTGVAVVVASRVDGAALGGQILATSTVRDLVAGSGIEFAERGRHELTGLDRAWDLFEVTRGPVYLR